MSISNSSPCLTTAHALISAYNTWNIDTIMSLRSPTCVHEIAPSSLNRPPQTNEQYKTSFQEIMPLFQNFTLEIKDSVVDENAKKVVLWATSTASTMLGPYRNEYVLILYLTEDGKMVERLVEFVDSMFSADFFGRLREEVGKRKGGA